MEHTSPGEIIPVLGRILLDGLKCMGQNEETQKTRQEKKDLYYVIKLSLCNKLMMY